MEQDHIVIIYSNRKIKLIGEITGTSVGTYRNNITFVSNDVPTLQEIKQLSENHFNIHKFNIICHYGTFIGCFVKDYSHSFSNLFTEVTFIYDTSYEVDMNTQIMLKIEEYYKSKKHNSRTTV